MLRRPFCELIYGMRLTGDWYVFQLISVEIPLSHTCLYQRVMLYQIPPVRTIFDTDTRF